MFFLISTHSTKNCIIKIKNSVSQNVYRINTTKIIKILTNLITIYIEKVILFDNIQVNFLNVDHIFTVTGWTKCSGVIQCYFCCNIFQVLLKFHTYFYTLIISVVIFFNIKKNSHLLLYHIYYFLITNLAFKDLNP